MKSILNFMKMLTISKNELVPEPGRRNWVSSKGDGDQQPDVKYRIKVPPPTRPQKQAYPEFRTEEPFYPVHLSLAELDLTRPWWLNQAHPSRDNYGRRIHHWKEYLIRRRDGDVGQTARVLYGENDGSAEEDFGPLYPTREPELPTFSILMDILPKFCHRYLAPEGKKDVRIWLWKGRKGRRARTRIREYLKMFEEDGESTAIEYLIGL